MAGPGSALLPTDINSLLAAAKNAVANRMRESIDRGWEIFNTRADGPVALNTFRANRSQWDDTNREMLRRLFKSDALRQAYDKTGTIPPGAVAPKQELERLRASVEDRLALLQAILDRIEPGAEGAATSSPGITGSKAPIFVAHAGDTPLARNVARYLESLHLTPIVVTDRPGEGEVNVTQLDAYPDARFGIVIVAGDQLPESSSGQPIRSGPPRTRSPNPQAMTWLGYFAGRLGRKRVVSLFQPGLPIPGRELGLRGIEFDEAGAWKTQLTRRLDGSDNGD